MSQTQFCKPLAKFYLKWYRDCCDSVLYCAAKSDTVGVEYYTYRANKYFNIILNHWEDLA